MSRFGGSQSEGMEAGPRPARRWLLATGGVCVALLAAACGGNATSSSPSSSSGSSSAASSSPTAQANKTNYTVAFVAGVAHNNFYQVMQQPAEQEAAKLGMKLIWQPPASFSASAEVPILQTLLAEHPSALIVTPDDPVALKAPIESFIQAGIPVITVDTELADSSIVTSQITSDGYQGGTLAADATAKSCGDKGTVFVMEADTTTTTLVLRGNGFLTEMKKYPGITVLPVQYDHHSIPTASSIASALLTSHPDICGIFATNNTAAEGISSALLEAGLSGKVFLVGFDAGPTEVSLLKGGTISELIIQQPALEATTAVQYAYDYLTGQKSKIQHTVELKNVVATHADANSPSIEKYYYTG